MKFRTKLMWTRAKNSGHMWYSRNFKWHSTKYVTSKLVSFKPVTLKPMTLKSVTLQSVQNYIICNKCDSMSHWLIFPSDFLCLCSTLLKLSFHEAFNVWCSVGGAVHCTRLLKTSLAKSLSSPPQIMHQILFLFSSSTFDRSQIMRTQLSLSCWKMFLISFEKNLQFFWSLFEDHHHHCMHCLWSILLLCRWDKTIFLFQRCVAKLPIAEEKFNANHNFGHRDISFLIRGGKTKVAR